MPNFDILNKARLREGPMGTTDADGWNGAFVLSIPGEARLVCVIASNLDGWEHVSVSFGQASPKTPSWEIMCAVKDLFWEPEQTVIQIHPPKSDHVNYHPGCLHMWRSIDVPFGPMPPSVMVGPKDPTKMKEEIAEFLKERNEALLSMDEAKIRAYWKKHNGVDMPAEPNSDKFWTSVHFAVACCKTLPDDARQRSRSWLKEHGKKSPEEFLQDANEETSFKKTI